MAKKDYGMNDYGDAAFDAALTHEVGSVRVGKREYAVGLIWHKIDDLSRANAQARALASDENHKYDFFCIKAGGDPQFGLGNKNLGHKNGLPSLAAQLAHAKPGRWLGLFAVDGGYYLAAIYDDAILSEADRFFSDAEAAKDEFENLHSGTEWKEAIAPDEFDIPGTVPVSISTLLDDRVVCRLQAVSKRGTLAKVALGACLVVGLVGGVNFYLKHLEDIELDRLLAEEAAKARDQIFAPKQDQIVVPDAPWIVHPVASYFVESCVTKIHSFPLDIPGWDVKEFICSGNTVAASLDRAGALGKGGGSYNWIKLLVEKEGFKPRIIAPPGGNGNRASVQWGLGELPKIPVDIETLKYHQMMEGLVVVMDERFVPISLADAPENSDFFKGVSFSFSTSDDPRDFTDILSALPGAFVTSIKYDVPSNSWTLEGQAYEQLPLPETKPN